MPTLPEEYRSFARSLVCDNVIANCRLSFAGSERFDLLARQARHNAPGREAEQHLGEQRGRDQALRLWRFRATDRFDGPFVRRHAKLHVGKRPS